MEVSRLSPQAWSRTRSAEHTSELQSPCNLACRLLLEKKDRVVFVSLQSAAGPLQRQDSGVGILAANPAFRPFIRTPTPQLPSGLSPTPCTTPSARVRT